jgi:hypothetical protein
MIDCHLVIRGTGERTEAAALELAKPQLATEHEISCIHCSPFEEALRATYEAGIRAGKQWTITLDGDVLLRPGALAELVKSAQEMPAHYFQLEGRIYDKVTGQYRQAGHRIYRTELLPAALKQLPAAGTQLRPETFVVLQMNSRGHPYRHVGCVVGLHDFEQSYSDLYQKALVHSKKTTVMLSRLIERCSRRAHEDTDFLVLLKGIWDGLTIEKSVTLDRRLYVNQATAALEELGIQEKADIDIGEFLLSFEDRFMNVTRADPAPDVPVLDDLKPVLERPRWIDKAQRRFAKHGPIRGSAACLGALLKHVGHVLDR